MRYGSGVDEQDEILLTALRADATQSYAALGRAAGLSAGAAHERVRKLRERGVIRRTTVAVGLPVLSFVLVDGDAWLGGEETRAALAELPELVECHIVAGSASLLAKVRTPSTEALQDVLRRIFAIDGVTGTQTIVVLESMFDGRG
jgi:DNA-binding Lrp family transcriptional regulator